MEKKSSPPAMPTLRMSRIEREWFLTLISHFASASNSVCPAHERWEVYAAAWLSATGAELDPARGGWSLFTYRWALNVFPAYIKPLYLKEEKYIQEEKLIAWNVLQTAMKKIHKKEIVCVSMCVHV